MPGNSGGGVWFVDLAPTPALVEVATARALGLPDQPGGSTTDTLLRFIRDPHMLMAR
jgi:predicted ATPase